MTTQLDPNASPDTPREAPSRATSAALGGADTPEGGGNETNISGLVILAGLLILLWVKGGANSVVFVLGLVVMIFLHELGHFVTARKTGMKATRFFVGMGPTIISRTYGETEYGLKAIPAGAFVAITGMSNLDPIDPADEPRAYKNATFPRRMLVITAGSMMHFFQAIIIFVFMFSIIGVPDSDGRWVVQTLSKLDDGSPAPSMQAGLEIGDRIVTIDDQAVPTFENLREAVSDRAGDEVTLGIERGSETFERSATLASIQDAEGTTRGFLGVGPEFTEQRRFSPTVGLEAFTTTFTGSFSMIGQIFSPSGFQNLVSLMADGSEDVAIDSDEASGRPVSLVGIVRIAGDDKFDWFGRLLLLGSINVFVGIFNLFPLLPLDGGHAAVAIYERIRSRKDRMYHVDFAKLMPPTYVVIGLLGFLFISTLWLDLFRPIS